MTELPDKAANFIEWYLAAVDAAELTDKRYPVKGMNVWTPFGFQARRALDRILIEEIESTGSKPVEFPTLIPAPEFAKEKEHIKGFDAQVYWVTKGGESELDVPLVLRPTSETAMYPIFALWVRAHSDLPLTVYQIVNTFRYETKTTRPFLRVREIHFFEEHTCQLDEAAGTRRVEENLRAFARMAERMKLPYLVSRRPEWDKFPGAFYTLALDAPVGGGRTLQLGSIHHYRENFSRPYGISYETAGGPRAFVHQTTFGLSERLIGVVVSVHGDRRGVAFPSELAPYAVVIVPIPDRERSEAVPRFAEELAGRLRARGLRVHLDATEDRPGAKYYRWESKGIPLRIEVGAREAAQRSATIVDRLGHKSSAGPNDLEDGLLGAIAEYDARLYERARAEYRASFALAERLEDLAGSAHVRILSWCGSEECGHRIEQAIEGALLGTIVGEPPFPLGPPKPCVGCGSTAGAQWASAARPM